LLGVAALTTALSGCGAGSEALPSDLPPPVGGSVLSITTTAMEDGVFMRSYSKTLNTTGGTPPLVSCTFTAGTPPPGLNPAPSGSDCIISGTPTMAGSFTFTVRAEDSNNIADTQDYTMAIRDEFTITGMAPDPLPDGVEDTAYNFVFTVTTDTVTGPNDFNQVAENGNGPITMCTLGGLPAGMMAVGGTFTANSCQITVSGAPNIGIAPMGAPMLFQLTLSVTDTGISGSSTPPGTVTQTAIDLTIQPPVAITLITTDPASTAGCTGGTFDDSTGGGVAPDGVTGRTYGDPQCDLLFMATGGIVPYAWTDNSAMPPAPFGCAQEGADNEFFRCNSNMMALTTPGGTATDVTVEVMDSGSMAAAASTVGTDIFGHASHSIFVNDEIALVSDLGNPLPDAVMGQPYGEAPDTPATFTASGGLGLTTGYTFANVVGLTMPGAGFPDTIACNPTVPGGEVLACSTNASTITAATGTYMPFVDVDDAANDTTPDSVTAGTTASVTVDLDVVAAMMFTLVTADAATTMACTGGTFADTTGDAPDAVTGRTYGDPGGGGAGPPDCDLLFQVTGGRAPYAWNTNSAAPAPIACAQEGADNEFFRCNSAGGGVSGGTSTLGVDVTDTGSSTLGPLNVFIDDQGHGGHMINVRDEFASLTITPAGAGGAQDGVTGRPYGTPTGSQDLVISFPVNTGIGPVTMTPDENTTAGQSAAQGFPNDLDCVQTIDRQIECTTGAGVITDPAALYMPVVTGDDTGNDTTPAGGFGSNFNLVINDEITINPVLFTNGITGQAYSHTLSCDPMLGFCGGTGNPNTIDAIYTWGESDTAGLCPSGAPANADITMSTLIATNPSTGQYSGTPTTTGMFTPGICVVDDGNDNTPDCHTAGTCPIFSPTYNIFAPLVAVDASNNEVDFYETTGGALTFNSNLTLDAGSTPFRVAFTPNAGFAVAVDAAEGELDFIDIAAGSTTSVPHIPSFSPATSVAIGPASDPLTSPDAWLAYAPLNDIFFNGLVEVFSVDPNNMFATSVNIIPIPVAMLFDIAITPTFPGPDTRLYALGSTFQEVCVIDAQPGSPSFQTPLIVGPSPNGCIDVSGVPGVPVNIEIASGFAFVTKSTGFIVAIDILPGSPSRDTIVGLNDLAAAAGCTAPGDLRTHPGGGQLWVTCPADDQITIVDPFTVGVLTSFSTGAGTSPRDVAFNINGSFAVVTLNTTDEILPVSIDLMSGVATPGTAVTLANVTGPDGVDHNQDPQLNALIGPAFPIAAGQAATRQVVARGGVQPYTFTDSSAALGVPGTACQGLSLDSHTGRISGTPMQPGTCTFSVTVSDSNGQSRTVEGRIEVKP